MAKFSVIIPVYNVEKEIRQCLDSIKNQTYGDFEVLCVDDCGQDSSMAIVKEFADTDDRFKILTHEHNKGVSAARNTALDAASGEYILFVDSDDWIELNALETVKNVFDQSNTDMVMFDTYDCYPDKERKAFNVKNLSDGKIDMQLTIDANNLNSFIGVIWNRAYRASLIQDNHIRFPEGMIIEDSDFTFKASVLAGNIYIITTPLYNYRREREGSYTTEDKVNTRIEDELNVIFRCWRWAKEHNYARRYRKYFLFLIGITTKKILGIPHRRRYILEKMRDLLTEINFPEDFKDLDKKHFTLWMNK